MAIISLTFPISPKKELFSLLWNWEYENHWEVMNWQSILKRDNISSYKPLIGPNYSWSIFIIFLTEADTIEYSILTLRSHWPMWGF
jgi:hypothetical protein